MTTSSGGTDGACGWVGEKLEMSDRLGLAIFDLEDLTAGIRNDRIVRGASAIPDNAANAKVPHVIPGNDTGFAERLDRDGQDGHDKAAHTDIDTLDTCGRSVPRALQTICWVQSPASAQNTAGA